MLMTVNVTLTKEFELATAATAAAAAATAATAAATATAAAQLVLAAIVTMRALLSLAMFISAAAVTCPVHGLVYGAYTNVGATETECPADGLCFKRMIIQPSCARPSGDGGPNCIGAIEHMCAAKIQTAFPI